MKKVNAFRNSIFYRRKNVFQVLLIIGILLSSQLNAQVYTYTTESFEDNIWNNAPNSSNDIISSTGTWSVAKSNIQSTAVTAQDGTYSLVFANKTNGLITPYLSNGAGVLTYNIIKTSSRIIMVSTSADKVNWSNAVDSFVVTSAWTKRTVVINKYALKYIRFQTNSNGGTYIDNILITGSGAAGVSTTTSIPTLITQTSALASGTITSDGSTSIINRGFCYNLTGNPDTSSSKIVVTGTTGQFTGTINNLSMGTKYYVKAYAVTAIGVSYSPVVSFITREADAPVAYWTQPFNDDSQFPTTQPTSPVSINVTNQGTWIYLYAYKSTNPLYISDGSVSDLRMIKNGGYVTTPILTDGVTSITFYEGRGDRDLTVYTSTDGGTNWTTLQTVTSVKGEAITLSVNSASVNRIKIANNSGSDADIDNITITVFPTGTEPGVTTTAVTNIGKNTATTGGEVTSVGSKPVVEQGVCWSTITTPIIADNKTSDGADVGNYTSALSGLPAGTVIHMRAYATSRAGTGYGNELTFTTLSPTIPVVLTTKAISVEGELASSGGTVTDNGGAPIIVAGICWNTTGDPTILSSKTSDSTIVTGTFQNMLTNLTPNTKYYYRAYAVNIAGTGYGAVETLTTGGVWAPVVTTNEATSIYFYKATGGGTVTDDGNAMTVRGICWNTAGNPTIADNKTICGNGAGIFSGIMTNLNENTQYYVRAYVTNSVGTAYGNQATFSTPISTKLSKPIGYGAGTTGGGTPTAANTVIVTNASELSLALNGNKSVIIISGTITTPRLAASLTNRTILGLPGARLVNLDQTADGSGILHLTDGSSNVIIQNLIFEGPGAYDTDGWDLLTDKGCNKLWVDHCEFQDGTDDCFDNSNSADSITVSWCKFTYLKPPKAGGSGGSADHRFANLIGGSDSDYPADGHYSITWQNCWWAAGCVERMVRARNAELHILNCYWNSPNTKSVIGLTAGTNGSTCYVEGGVFSCPGTISDIASGSIAINFVNCTGGGTNIGTVSKPAYEYNAMPVDQVVTSVTNSSCGAGASLFVTTSGEVYSNCPTTPILSSTSNGMQEVYAGNAITSIVFTWGGTATDVTVSGLPAGLTSVKDAVAKTITISGTPTASGTFTVTTIGGSGLPASKQGTITVTSIPPATLSNSGNIDQTVSSGSAITNIVFTWGGGATDVTVSGLPSGLTGVKDAAAKTLTISGTPTNMTTYTITTVGGTGPAILMQGTIKIKYGTGTFKIAYVTNNTLGTYMNDVKILTSLKADPNFVITEVSSATAGNDYSAYQLVLFSEVAGSTDPGVLELEGINKPFIMMKVNAYKSDVGAWNWSSSATAYGQNTTETNIAVIDKTHPIFKDVTWVNTNEVQVLSAVSGQKGLTYMDPVSFKNVSGGGIKSLAFVKGQTSQVSILKIPAGANVAGTLVPKPFIQIGINSSSYANVTNDGVSIVKNACFYLLGLIDTAALPVPTLSSPDNRTQTVTTGMPVANIVFTWGGGATDVIVSDLPAGLSSTKNTANKTLTISGTPTVMGTYTISTLGGSGAAVSVQGTITSNTDPTEVITIQKQLHGITGFTCNPNIVSEETKVNFDAGYNGKMLLSAIDMNGKTVYQEAITFKEGNNTISIDLSGLHPGLYILSLNAEGRINKLKLIKK